MAGSASKPSSSILNLPISNLQIFNSEPSAGVFTPFAGYPESSLMNELSGL
jgi:hypothetical protein